MKRVILYYFSGTGNSLKVGNQIQKTFEENGFKCDVAKMEDDQLKPIEMGGDYDYVGLVFPVAIQSTYPLVWSFVNNLPNGNHQKIFMVDTMQMFSGGVVGPMKQILESKNYQCVGALEVKMISSRQTKDFSRENMLHKHEQALNKTSAFIEALLQGKTTWRRIPLLSDWMRSISKGDKIWRQMSEQIKLSEEACIKCGLCKKKCPVGAIEMVEGIPKTDHDQCNVCMRCVHSCPVNAYTLNGKPVVKLV